MLNSTTPMEWVTHPFGDDFAHSKADFRYLALTLHQYDSGVFSWKVGVLRR